MIQPDFKTFCRLAKQGNLVPVYETVRADLLTPVGAYLRLARDAHYACLLESVEGGEKIARYTFMGANPAEVFRFHEGACVVESAGRVQLEYAKRPLEFLRKLTARYRPVRVPGLPPLVGGAIGYFAYDMVRLFEQIPDTGRDDMSLDDSVMMFYLGLVVFDHVQHRLWIIRNVLRTGRAAYAQNTTPRFAKSPRNAVCLANRWPAKIAPQQARQEQATAIQIQYNQDQLPGRGAQSQEIHSRRRYFSGGAEPAISMPRSKADPFEVYRALRVVNPSPYMYYLKLGDLAVVGVHPKCW